MNPQEPNPGQYSGAPAPTPVAAVPQNQPYPQQQLQSPPAPQQYPQQPAPVVQPQQQYAAPQQAPAPTQYAAPQQPQPQPQTQMAQQDPRYAVQAMQGAPNAQTQPKAAPATSNPNSTQNTLQIAEIRDGIVILNDGNYRSVLMVKSINFDLMSQQEQEAVELNYQNFLNSLYFPIQIFIRSQKVDLRPYIEKLDKIRTEHDNMLLALLMDDYIGYMDALSQQTNIMDKKFYIVIPYSPIEQADLKQGIQQSKSFFTGLGGLFKNKEQKVVINEADLEKAKNELRNRIQAVLSGLMQCGIQGLPLDTQELIELYYDTYNPDTATRQQLKNFNDLSVDVITKGDGSATQPHLQKELQ